MALLSEQEESLIEAWFEDKPKEAALYFYSRKRMLGVKSDDSDDLIRAIKSQRPSEWSGLITALESRYAASEADVEREVGRAVLTKSTSRSELATQLDTVDVSKSDTNGDSSVELAKARARAQRAENRLAEIELKELIVSIRNMLWDAYPGYHDLVQNDGPEGTFLSYQAGLIAPWVQRGFITLEQAVDVYEAARELAQDISPSKKDIEFAVRYIRA